MSGSGQTDGNVESDQGFHPETGVLGTDLSGTGCSTSVHRPVTSLSDKSAGVLPQVEPDLLSSVTEVGVGDELEPEPELSVTRLVLTQSDLLDSSFSVPLS